MKSKFTTILLILVFFAGLSLLLYPSVSDYINTLHSSKAVAAYDEDVKTMAREDYTQHWTDAVAYNQSLLARPNSFILTDAQREQYNTLLDIGGRGIMGYIEIPTINCSLPIYHGTDESVLNIAIGHLDWTSLPVGGESTHCVLSGHRGLPSAKLFTNLDRLVVGDTFVIRILDEALTYEVDQILIVEPNDVSALVIAEGRDLCTLVTCTPYGVNSHRLLVRGHRIENMEAAKAIRIVSDAIQIEPLIVAPIVALPLLLALFILLFILDRKQADASAS